MTDEIDQTVERIEFDTQILVGAVCQQARNFDPGEAGECDLCGEEFSRVVRVLKNDEYILSCGRCRDKHGLS